MMEPVEPDDEAIRWRAYEISQRADGGSPEENWRRAKEELRDEAWQQDAPSDEKAVAGEP